jgi:hypothetical protein
MSFTPDAMMTGFKISAPTELGPCDDNLDTVSQEKMNEATGYDNNEM